MIFGCWNLESLDTLGIVILYYCPGHFGWKSWWNFGWTKNSVCVQKMGQLRTWMTDCVTELVLLPKVGKFSGSICWLPDSRYGGQFWFCAGKGSRWYINCIRLISATYLGELWSYLSCWLILYWRDMRQTLISVLDLRYGSCKSFECWLIIFVEFWGFDVGVTRRLGIEVSVDSIRGILVSSLCYYIGLE